MMDEEQKRKYRKLYSQLKQISNDVGKIEDSLFYMKEALNNNFIINGRGLCTEKLQTPISHMEFIQEDLNYKVLPYISDRMY